MPIYQLNLGKKVAQVTDYHSCCLSKRYATDDKVLFAKTSSFKNINTPHAVVHNMETARTELFLLAEQMIDEVTKK